MRRYFLGHDNSGHEYAVPVDSSAEWLAWVELPDDDPDGWEVPSWAIPLDGRFTFIDPKCEQ